MASTTPNLGLKLLGSSVADKEKLFQAWRLDIAGENNQSNMEIIDEAFGDLDDAIHDIITNSQIDALFDD